MEEEVRTRFNDALARQLHRAGLTPKEFRELKRDGFYNRVRDGEGAVHHYLNFVKILITHTDGTIEEPAVEPDQFRFQLEGDGYASEHVPVVAVVDRAPVIEPEPVRDRGAAIARVVLVIIGLVLIGTMKAVYAVAGALIVILGLVARGPVQSVEKNVGV